MKSALIILPNGLKHRRMQNGRNHDFNTRQARLGFLPQNRLSAVLISTDYNVILLFFQLQSPSLSPFRPLELRREALLTDESLPDNALREVADIE
jgi:hypothetical protein